jgi:hypothetical protein
MQARWTNRLGLAFVALGVIIGNGCSSDRLVTGGSTFHGEDAGNAGTGGASAGGVGGTSAGGAGGTSAGGPGGQGNPTNDGGVLSCAMTIAQACARDAGGGGCDLTWSAVLEDSSLCASSATLPHYAVWTCGGYDVLSIRYIDGGSDFYYDGTTGALVAILGVGINGGNPCAGGPAVGFTPPSDCNTIWTSPPQCTSDPGNGDGPRD